MFWQLPESLVVATYISYWKFFPVLDSHFIRFQPEFFCLPALRSRQIFGEQGCLLALSDELMKNLTFY